MSPCIFSGCCFCIESNGLFRTGSPNTVGDPFRFCPVLSLSRLSELYSFRANLASRFSLRSLSRRSSSSHSCCIRRANSSDFFSSSSRCRICFCCDDTMVGMPVPRAAAASAAAAAAAAADPFPSTPSTPPSFSASSRAIRSSASCLLRRSSSAAASSSRASLRTYSPSSTSCANLGSRCISSRFTSPCCTSCRWTPSSPTDGAVPPRTRESSTDRRCDWSGVSCSRCRCCCCSFELG